MKLIDNICPQDESHNLMAMLNIMRAQFHLLLGEVETAQSCFSSGLSGLSDQILPWPRYSFHWSEADRRSHKFSFGPSFRQLFKNPFQALAYLDLDPAPAATGANPYRTFKAETNFWWTAVAQRMPPQLTGLYHKN